MLATFLVTVAGHYMFCHRGAQKDAPLRARNLTAQPILGTRHHQRPKLLENLVPVHEKDTDFGDGHSAVFRAYLALLVHD
jgi:hypothetical protein